MTICRMCGAVTSNVPNFCSPACLMEFEKKEDHGAWMRNLLAFPPQTLVQKQVLIGKDPDDHKNDALAGFDNTIWMKSTGWECPSCHDIYTDEAHHPFCMKAPLKHHTVFTDGVERELKALLPHTLVALEEKIDQLRHEKCLLETQVFTLNALLDHCRRCHQG